MYASGHPDGLNERVGEVLLPQGGKHFEMITSPLPEFTQAELVALHDQFHTWIAVQIHLGLSEAQLVTLRQHLGCYTPHVLRVTKVPSVLDPYLSQIAELAAQGMNCPEIVKALSLPVQAEQLRRQMHRHGIPLLAKQGAQLGPKNVSWKGGRRPDKDGYILLCRPNHPDARKNGDLYEHRWVMEQKLGRRLEPQEVVHQINGDHTDNWIENLELFSDNAEHLAKTLKGHVPNWTEEGRARTFAGVRRPRSPRPVSQCIALASEGQDASETD